MDDGHEASMHPMKMSRVFTLIEPGPVVLVTTCDGNKNNVMTISWTMVLDFTPMFAITTGAWNYSFAALQRTREWQGPSDTSATHANTTIRVREASRDFRQEVGLSQTSEAMASTSPMERSGLS